MNNNNNNVSSFVPHEEFIERFVEGYTYDEDLVRVAWDFLSVMPAESEVEARNTVNLACTVFNDYLESLDKFGMDMPKFVGRTQTVFFSYFVRCMHLPEAAGKVLIETLNGLRMLGR